MGGLPAQTGNFPNPGGLSTTYLVQRHYVRPNFLCYSFDGRSTYGETLRHVFPKLQTYLGGAFSFLTYFLKRSGMAQDVSHEVAAYYGRV